MCDSVCVCVCVCLCVCMHVCVCVCVGGGEGAWLGMCLFVYAKFQCTSQKKIWKNKISKLQIRKSIISKFLYKCMYTQVN